VDHLGMWVGREEAGAGRAEVNECNGLFSTLDVVMAENRVA
jgi:hypothetical protein